MEIAGLELSGRAIAMLALAITIAAIICSDRFRTKRYRPLSVRFGKTGDANRPKLGMEATDLSAVDQLDRHHDSKRRGLFRGGYDSYRAPEFSDAGYCTRYHAAFGNKSKG